MQPESTGEAATRVAGDGISAQANPEIPLRLALCVFLIAGVAASCGCTSYPIPKARGGKGLVEVSRLNAVPSFNYPVFAYERLRPPASALAALDRVVVLPFYSFYRPDMPRDYELLGLYSVPAQGGQVAYPLRLRWAWVRKGALGWYVSDNRPDLGAFVFARGCLPWKLGCHPGGGNNGVYLPDRDSPGYRHRPPRGFQARIICIMIPEEAMGEEQYRCLARVGALGRDRPDLLEALGHDNLRRFTDLLEHSSKLSDSERQMVCRQLLMICDHAMQEPDNEPYLEAYRELRNSLVELRRSGP